MLKSVKNPMLSTLVIDFLITIKELLYFFMLCFIFITPIYIQQYKYIWFRQTDFLLSNMVLF